MILSPIRLMESDYERGQCINGTITMPIFTDEYSSYVLLCQTFNAFHVKSHGDFMVVDFRVFKIVYKKE